MKLKPQPPRPARGTGRRAGPARAKHLPRRGRGARRPGEPLRHRVRRRLPSLGRVAAVLGAAVSIGVLAAAVNGPWLRVAAVTFEGQQHTAASALEEILDDVRGGSLMAVDTRALTERIERLPAVEGASVTASLTGRIEATVTEREPAFVWQTASARFIGDAGGTIFAVYRSDDPLPDGLDALPRIRDERFVARVVSVGDVIPAALLSTAMRVIEIDPAALGSDAGDLSVSLDDEYGFRVASTDPGWEVALGVYGLDPSETAAEAQARLERQVTAVRTLFATHPEAGIAWVDARNPGKVYFRAKG